MSRSRVITQPAPAAEPTQIDVIDEETGEAVPLNRKTFGQTKTHAAFDSDKSQDAPTLRLYSITHGLAQTTATANTATWKRMSIEDMKLTHERELADYVAREAQREELRKALLAAETSEWRRATMGKVFLEERLAAAKGLQELKLQQEIALAKYMRSHGMLR